MSSNLIRWGGLAAALAGALFVAADLLSLSISPKFPSSESLTSEPYAIQSVLKLVAAVLLLLGLFGLHARQAAAAGPLGTAAFLAAFSGTALVVGSFWATAFFAPAWASVDPAGFDAGEGPPGRLADAFVVSGATFVLGWMLFGGAAWRARIYPRGRLAPALRLATRARHAARRRVPYRRLLQRGPGLAGLHPLVAEGRAGRTTRAG